MVAPGGPPSTWWETGSGSPLIAVPPQSRLSFLDCKHELPLHSAEPFFTKGTWKHRWFYSRERLFPSSPVTEARVPTVSVRPDYKSTSARWLPHFVSPSRYILSFSETLALWMGLVMSVPGSYSSLTARNSNRAPHPCLTPLSCCCSHAMPVSKGKGVMGRRRSKQKWSVWSPVGAQPGDWGPDAGMVPSWILGLPCLGRNGVCFASPAL